MAENLATAGAGQAMGYSFGPVSVDVLTDSVDPNRWLREFLTPWISAVPFGEADTLVRFGSSGDLFETLTRRSAFACNTNPFFTLDSRIVTLPSWEDDEGVVFADEDLHCFYRLRTRSVEIVGRPGERRARIGLLRVVRELLATRRLASGALLDLHAAAFEIDGRAVLIAGPKHAGKTTLLCHALASGMTRAIANDHVLVDVAQDCSNVHGIPTLVGIRPNTAQLFSNLHGGPDDRPVLLHSGENEPPRARNVRSLSLTQVAERLGASVLPSAPLGAVVFPEIVPSDSSSSIGRLTRSEGLARLATCFYGNSAPSSVNQNALAERIAQGVQFFQCTLGTRAYESNAVEWLRAVAPQ